MKILIYGFESYNLEKKNISQEVIKRFSIRTNLIKFVFPVKFAQKTFLEKIKKLKPDFILGLGQHPRARKIRIERKAINLYGRTGQKPKIILPEKPKYLFLNWKLKKDKNSYYSYHAGKFVCNFSMYLIADYCQEKKIKFAFLHLPKNCHQTQVIEFINFQINTGRKFKERSFIVKVNGFSPR